MKTIRQLADEIGVTKQAIHQKMKKPPLSTDLQPFISKIENTVYIDEQGEMLIKQAFPSHSVNVVDAVDDKQSSSIDGKAFEILQKQLEFLQGQLTVKDEQIEKLTAALEHTTASLHAAQALHAGTMQKQLTEGQTDDAQDDKPRRWWPFGRKKDGQ